MIIKLNSLWRLRKERYGAKAVGIQWAAKRGFLTAPGIVITSDEGPGRISDAVSELQKISPVCTYAVRSSGIGEDGADSSYAGQHLTLLNVAVGDVPEAIERVRASEADSYEYRRAQRLDACGTMAVIVQVMVKAKHAGVMFTSNPENGSRHEAVLEYVEGLGDKLVGGEVNPAGSYNISKAEGPGSDGADVPDVVQRVYLALADIEAQWGGPVDIEWAWGKRFKRPHVMQVRPLTGVDWVLFDMNGKGIGRDIGRGPVQWMPTYHPPFEAGSVLASKMTDPHMVEAMIASAGIATVIGGRTCHAAIIARELGKPCVVGVEYLTQIRDGDCVEVDPARGEVRKV